MNGVLVGVALFVILSLFTAALLLWLGRDAVGRNDE